MFIKTHFLQIRWNPELRITPDQAMKHPWMAPMVGTCKDFARAQSVEDASRKSSKMVQDIRHFTVKELNTGKLEKDIIN